jgi:predicted RNA-binding protein with PUA-like domain
MKYWLLKTEGDVYPIEQLEQDGKSPWTGVRNFRARNYMRDEMRIGDACLFYHSSCKEPGVYGLAKVLSAPYPDPTQFDKKSTYFDPKASEVHPIWMLVDIGFVKKLKFPILATGMKKDPTLKDMLLWKLPRLSIQPVTEKHFSHITGSAQLSNASLNLPHLSKTLGG